MTRSNTNIVLAALVCGACNAPGHAGDEPPPRTITVTGTADVRLVPDEVAIALGVESFHKELKQAKRDNDERVQRVLVVFELE